MKLRFLNIVVFCVLAFGLISCDRPQCNNQNPIFDSNLPESKFYKDELVKQLESIDQTKLTYWLQKYDEKEGREYLYFHIQGDGLCAQIVLTMYQWNKLEMVREKKGVSYRGAEFTELKFDVQQDSLTTDFVYKTFDRIID